MSEATKGEWRVGFPDGSGDEYVVVGNGNETRLLATVRWGCGCCKDTSDLTPEEQANVRLLAAAKASYEALKKLYEQYVVELHGEKTCDCDTHMPTCTPCLARAVFERVEGR